MTDLTSKSVHAIKWNVIGTIARFALQLIAQVILSRILGPISFGLFGLGLIVYTFGNFFSSFGFGRQLLQKQIITDADIRFAFTWQVLLGGLATTIIYLSASLIAEYFKSPDLVSVVQWLSFACVINAATAPANNLLGRDLKFKLVAKIQFISYFISYILVGIPLALYGVGVFALVYAWMLQLTLIMVLTYIAHPHSLKPLFWFSEGRDAMNYGGTVFMTNIVNWLLTNIDRVLVGRFLSVHVVGLYTVSYNLATLPNTLLLNGLQTIFLTSGAKTTNDVNKLRQNYKQVISTILVLIVPAFLVLSAISPALMQVLYGAKWVGSGEILAVMFLGVPALIVWGLSTPVLWNMGKKHHEALLQLPIFVLGALALYKYTASGAIVVAWIFVAIAYSRAFVMLYSALKVLDLKVLSLLSSFVRSVLFSLTFYATSIITIFTLKPYQSALLDLIVTSLMALILGLVITLRFSSLLGVDVLKMLGKFHPRFTAK